jgi:hypothetical protein
MSRGRGGGVFWGVVWGGGRAGNHQNTPMFKKKKDINGM